MILKKITLKICSGAVAGLLLIGNLVTPAQALYRGVLGDVYSAHTRQIGPGVDYTHYLSITDGLNESAYLFEYRPQEGALPLVSYGNELMGSNKVTSLAEHEQSLGYDVIAGVNGDFYSVYTGIPMGAVIRDGRIVSDDDKNVAVGFTENGETVFGDPGIYFSVIHSYDTPIITYDYEEDTVTDEGSDDLVDELSKSDEESETDNTEPSAEEDDYEETKPSDDEDDTEETELEDGEEQEVADENFEESKGDIESVKDDFEEIGESSDDALYREELPVSYFNKYPTEWGAYLLDETFSASTCSTKPSLEIVIELDSPDMLPCANGILSGTISEVHDNATNTPIKPGTVVISVCETSSYRQNYNNISPGNRILINFQVASGWENVRTAIGGSDLFIVDGEIQEHVIDEYHETIANPRTAVGVRGDGTVIFFAVDGRSDDSYGLRMVSLARTLLSFGCVTAMNLDGGGSTTAIVKYPGENEFTLVNQPSNYSQRAVSNALLLVNTAKSDGIPRYLIPTDTEPVILPGENYSFTGDVYDASMTKLESSEETSYITDNVKLQFDKSRLSYYSEDNMPDLGTISEDGKTFTASGITGEIPLLFTSEHNGELLTGRTTLFVAPAPDTVDIDLGSTVYSPADGFDIEFNAYYRGKPVPAKVEHLSFSLNDLEVRKAHVINESDDENNKLADSQIGYVTDHGRFMPYPDADGATWLTISLDGIPMTQALVVCNQPYITALGELEISYSFPAAESEITTSDDALTTVEEDTTTDESIAVEETIDASADDDIIAEPPVEQESAESSDSTTETYDDINVQSDESSEPAEAEATPVLDESVTFESDLPVAGALSLDLYATDADLELHALVLDQNGDEQKVIYEKQVNEPTVDELCHYRAVLDPASQSLSAALCIDSDVNAGKAGVISISSVRVSFDDTETVFYDTYNHWARQNINALYREGIVGGEEYDGRIRFAPDRTLSRAEFAVIISRSLGYDISKYTTAPEFHDVDDIPQWASAYVCAVSENKVMNGKSMPDGTLCFDPAGKISRQEIMQVIGNILKQKESEALVETISEEQEDQELSEVDIEVIETVVEQLIEAPSPAFTDTGDIAAWAYENVLLTLETGIVTGYSDNTLRPAQNVTRAESATIVLRTINHLARISAEQ